MNRTSTLEIPFQNVLSQPEMVDYLHENMGRGRRFLTGDAWRIRGVHDGTTALEIARFVSLTCKELIQIDYELQPHELDFHARGTQNDQVLLLTDTIRDNHSEANLLQCYVVGRVNHVLNRDIGMILQLPGDL